MKQGSVTTKLLNDLGVVKEGKAIGSKHHSPKRSLNGESIIVSSPSRKDEIDIISTGENVGMHKSQMTDGADILASEFLQETTQQINDKMANEAYIYQKKIKALKAIKGEATYVSNEIVLEENKEAFKMTLAKIGTTMYSNQKVSLEPKVPYTFTLEPVGAVFFEIQCFGKPSPIILRVVNDTDGQRSLGLGKN